MKLASMVRVAEREGDLRKGAPQKAGIVAGCLARGNKGGGIPRGTAPGRMGVGRESRQDKQARRGGENPSRSYYGTFPVVSLLGH